MQSHKRSPLAVFSMALLFLGGLPCMTLEEPNRNLVVTSIMTHAKGTTPHEDHELVTSILVSFDLDFF
jgi:hypothetical protein